MVAKLPKTLTVTLHFGIDWQNFSCAYSCNAVFSETLLFSHILQEFSDAQHSWSKPISTSSGGIRANDTQDFIKVLTFICWPYTSFSPRSCTLRQLAWAKWKKQPAKTTWTLIFPETNYERAKNKKSFPVIRTRVVGWKNSLPAMSIAAPME